MVCERCINLIREQVHQMNLCVRNISLGRITFCHELNRDDQEKLVSFLLDNGFETMSDRYSRLVHKVKEIVSQNLGNSQKTKFSVVLSEALTMNYDSISEIFSTSEGITLEKYIIRTRLEKVKELLVYTDKSLTEIAYLMAYSSINHLSRQFTEIEGIPPSHFRKVRSNKQKISGWHPEIV